MTYRNVILEEAASRLDEYNGIFQASAQIIRDMKAYQEAESMQNLLSACELLFRAHATATSYKDQEEASIRFDSAFLEYLKEDRYP